MKRGIRFHPPAFSPPAGTAWVLRRAFGPVGGPVEPDAPPEALLDLARQLGLSARIGARTPRRELEREVGPVSASSFARHAAACAAQGLRLERVIQDVIAAAAAEAAPVALLKFAALHRLGRLAPGSRWACDVDVLAPSSALAPLARVLEHGGWRPTGTAYEHQLPALTHPLGGAIELHRVMLGVRLGTGRRSAGFEDLAGVARLERCPGEDGEVWLPQREVLAAHAVAHGLGQHGFEPGSYPHLRLVADLQDLQLDFDPGSSRLIEGWLSRSIPAGEFRALLELVERLGSGEDALAPRRGDASTLLLHFLAGVLDCSYRDALKLERLRLPFSDSPRPVAAVRAARRALLPSRSELAAIYGPAGSLAGGLRQRLGRPFDVVRRLARSLNARRRNRAAVEAGSAKADDPGGRSSPWSPLEWARLAGSVLAVTHASLRVAWLLRRATVLEAAPRLRQGRRLPAALRSPRRLAAVADRLLFVLPPWSLGRCLKRSLVLLEVWARCGVEARLHLGMRRESPGPWEGHAWLSAEGLAPLESGYSEVAVV